MSEVPVERFRSLDADKISATIQRLCRRAEHRFPDSRRVGLTHRPDQEPEAGKPSGADRRRCRGARGKTAAHPPKPAAH